jgi:hypothetical protein
MSQIVTSKSDIAFEAPDWRLKFFRHADARSFLSHAEGSEENDGHDYAHADIGVCSGYVRNPVTVYNAFKNNTLQVIN